MGTTKTVALSINSIKREQIIVWAIKYKDRSHTRMANSMLIFVIHDVTFEEFQNILSEYELHLEHGNVHIIPESMYHFPHEDLMITCKS